MDALVLKIPESTRFTNEELFEFCSVNRELSIERDEFGNLIVVPLSGSDPGRINFKILGQLSQWVSDNQGLGEGFDSKAGFLLPNGSMRAADVAWVSMEKWAALTKEDRMRFAPIAPEFIIELK